MSEIDSKNPWGSSTEQVAPGVPVPTSDNIAGEEAKEKEKETEEGTHVDSKEHFQPSDREASAAPEPAVEPEAPAAPQPDFDDDFDDFGGFEESAKAGDDNEFGDFDQIPAEATAATAEPVVNISIPNDIIGANAPGAGAASDDRVQRLVAKLLASSHPQARDLSLQLSSALASTAPLVLSTSASLNTSTFTAGSLLVELTDAPASSSPSTTNEPKIVNVPNQHFQGQKWAQTWKSLAVDQTYSDNLSHNFRWKKSNVRKEFLRVMGMDEDMILAETVVAAGVPDHAVPTTDPGNSENNQVPVVAAAATSVSTDPRQADIDEAKKYCAVTEDEIRKMTTAELTSLIQSLAASQLKMQEQSNYWLDTKEQLVMDAEMHNKMISSLVQYATQGAKGSPRTTKSIFGGGKKKK
ncbi:UNVERIFIED_CONTAM: hypothetical protein HDU68_009379 [Siphonaria sp. JEL0065]|nr:hypothetical protein HDU68_009379 [Siphonaria sp. JEL0065]